MPCICSVQGCNSNYKKDMEIYGPIPVYKFPNDQEMKAKWLKAIKADTNFKLTKYSRVCRRHFNDDDFKYYQCSNGRPTESLLKHPLIKTTAVPSLSNYWKIGNKPQSIEKTQSVVSNRPTQIKPNHRDPIENYDEFIQSFKEKLVMNKRIHWQYFISGEIKLLIIINNHELKYIIYFRRIHYILST